MNVYADYHKVTSPKKLMSVVDGVTRLIKRWLEDHPELKITHMVVAGISGQSVAWPVSYKIGLPVCVIRKPGENSHGSTDVVGDGELGDYVIVDDLISTGATVDRMLGQIAKEAKDRDQGSPPSCRAIFLFNSSRSYGYQPRSYAGFPERPANDPKIPVVAEDFVCLA